MSPPGVPGQALRGFETLIKPFAINIVPPGVPGQAPERRGVKYYRHKLRKMKSAPLKISIIKYNRPVRIIIADRCWNFKIIGELGVN